MSGGSWDYLFARGLGEILEDLSTMVLMRERLRELGAEGEVVADMTAIIEDLREAHELGDALRAVWKEVEWHDSGDHSIHQLRQAIWLYVGSPPCEHEKRTPPQVSFMWLDDEQRGCQARYQYCERCGARIILERDVTL